MGQPSPDDSLWVMPLILNIELTNRCNLACRFCDWKRLSVSMRPGSMDTQLLQDILASVQHHRLYELGLVGLGEPLLDPNLEEHLRIVTQAGSSFQRITMNTNGLELDERNSRLICNSAVVHVTVSLNAADIESYRQLMGRDTFEQVITNIKVLMQARKDTHRNDLQVDVQIMEGAGTPSAVDSLLAAEREEGLRIFSRKVYSKPSVQETDCPLKAATPQIPVRYPCWSLFSRAYIDVNGWLYPCTIGNDCYREESDLCLGNVRTATFMELLNSSVARSARARALRGTLPFPECSSCNVWSLLPNNFIWDAAMSAWVLASESVRLPELDPESFNKRKG